jgi:prevent-host-death family protein
MSDKMYEMAKISVSVRELQQNLKAVMNRVERGETVEVTRHRRPVMRLTPVKLPAPAQPWPDLEARTRAIFGKRVLSTGGATVVIEGRGER